jgi:hypothetical protein
VTRGFETIDTLLTNLIGPMSEEQCKGCPPDRVCAWACRQGMGVTDNAIAAMLGIPLDADADFVRRALCECYS